MKFAREVIDLLASMPERDFRMKEILNHVNGQHPIAPGAETAARRAVERALQALVETGSVVVVRPFNSQRGWAYFRWVEKYNTEVVTDATEFATFRAGDCVC